MLSDSAPTTLRPELERQLFRNFCGSSSSRPHRDREELFELAIEKAGNADRSSVPIGDGIDNPRRPPLRFAVESVFARSEKTQSLQRLLLQFRIRVCGEVAVQVLLT